MNFHMLCDVLDRKKSVMYFSYFQEKKKKRRNTFCAMKVIQKTLLGKTVTFDKHCDWNWIYKIPFYSSTVPREFWLWFGQTLRLWKTTQKPVKAKQLKLKSFSAPSALISEEIMQFPWRPTNIFVQNPGLQFDLFLVCFMQGTVKLVSESQYTA